MAEEKLCPLSFNTPIHADILNCKKEKCAWWAKRIGGLNIEACSIRVLAENLFFIQEHLGRKHD